MIRWSIFLHFISFYILKEKSSKIKCILTCIFSQSERYPALQSQLPYSSSSSDPSDCRPQPPNLVLLGHQPFWLRCNGSACYEPDWENMGQLNFVYEIGESNFWPRPWIIMRFKGGEVNSSQQLFMSSSFLLGSDSRPPPLTTEELYPAWYYHR